MLGNLYSEIVARMAPSKAIVNLICLGTVVAVGNLVTGEDKNRLWLDNGAF